MNSSESTVFLVEDDDDMRRSLERMVASVGLRVQSYASPKSFLEQYNSDCPGCLVLDVRLPGISGLTLFERLRSEGYLVPVVFVSGHAEVEVAVKAIQAGAWDFLEKPFSRERMLDLINKAIEFDVEARSVRAEISEIEDRITSLTPRESEMLRFVMAGQSTKEIASRLGVSTKTVEGHRIHLFKKMQVAALPQLALLMARLELLRVLSQHPNKHALELAS